jgi:hypothetical protein
LIDVENAVREAIRRVRALNLPCQDIAGHRLVINHDERHCSRIVEQHIEGAYRQRLV